MSTSTPIKAVLFDLDDTLIDWSKRTVSYEDVTRKHILNIRAFLAAQGHPVPDGEQFFGHYREIVVRSWREAKKVWAGVNFGQVITQTLAAANLDTSKINLHDVLVACDWTPVPGITPYDDTHDVLTFLQENGYKIGLVTNSMHPMWMRDVELEAYDLLRYFDARVTSGDTGFMKPHPAIYNRALSLLNIAPHEAVFVGDRPGNDIIGANELGMTSVMIDPPHLNYDLEGVVPDFTITKLSELLPILKTLSEG
ncbi:MAG: HAD family hydrolase [Chloroflexota bacterium]